MRAFEHLNTRQQTEELRRIRQKAEAHLVRNPPRGPAVFAPREKLK